MAANTETFVVIRPPGKDQFGDPLPDAPTETDLTGCQFAPVASAEAGSASGSNQVDTHATIYRLGDPTEVDVRPTDRIRARGVVYQVVGEPAVWAGFGVVINIRRTAG